jgi:hypothetical protein
MFRYRILRAYSPYLIDAVVIVLTACIIAVLGVVSLVVSL